MLGLSVLIGSFGRFGFGILNDEDLPCCYTLKICAFIPENRYSWYLANTSYSLHSITDKQ